MDNPIAITLKRTTRAARQRAFQREFAPARLRSIRGKCSLQALAFIQLAAATARIPVHSSFGRLFAAQRLVPSPI
jgi:hypothetical protein